MLCHIGAIAEKFQRVVQPDSNQIFNLVGTNILDQGYEYNIYEIP